MIFGKILFLFIIKAILNPFSASLHVIPNNREYFSIIFNMKKCTLYSIKYGISFWFSSGLNIPKLVV